jgi:hypothetical protein
MIYMMYCKNVCKCHSNKRKEGRKEGRKERRKEGREGGRKEMFTVEEWIYLA